MGVTAKFKVGCRGCERVFFLEGVGREWWGFLAVQGYVRRGERFRRYKRALGLRVPSRGDLPRFQGVSRASRVVSRNFRGLHGATGSFWGFHEIF